MRFILCDDDKSHNATLSLMLETLNKKNNWDSIIACTGTSADDILAFANTHSGMDNLYFLDLDLGDQLSGLDIANRIREKDAQSYIVYITAHQEYMLDCYKTKASDFLIKPISQNQLEQCLEGVFRDYALIKRNDILKITIGSCSYLLKHEEIFYFEKQRDYMIVHTCNGELQWRENFDSLLSRLPEDKFIRIHKGYVINLDFVTQWSSAQKLIRLNNSIKLPASRSYIKTLNTVLRSSYGK